MRTLISGMLLVPEWLGLFAHGCSYRFQLAPLTRPFVCCRLVYGVPVVAAQESVTI